MTETLNPWTENAVATLRRLWDAGEPSSYIGAVIGCSSDAVRRKASRIGLAPRGLIKLKREDGQAAPDPKTSGALMQRILSAVERHRAVAVAPVEAPPVGGVHLADLHEHHCRAPLWGGGLADEDAMRFCGERAVVGSAYCAEHHALFLVGDEAWKRRVVNAGAHFAGSLWRKGKQAQL